MLRRVASASISSRALLLAVAVGVVVLGVGAFRSAPKDILPELGQPSVEVQTEALGLSAVEVEQLITVPLEQDLLNGVAFVDVIRSRSVAGLSSITITFERGTDLARARQVVDERLTQAHALPNVSKPPQMLQPRSSASRVLMIGASAPTLSALDLGVLARWTIRPRLMGVHGVANVTIFGQRERQLQVQVDPQELQARGVTLDQVISTTGNALWWSPLGRLEANTPGTGGFVDGPNQRLGVFHESPIKTEGDLARVALEPTGTGPEGAAPSPLTLGDVATVVQDHQPLIGDAVQDGGPALLFVVEKLPGADVGQVTRGVDAALRALGPGLPGVRLDPTVFRPADDVHDSTEHLVVALLVGVGLVALFLLVLGFRWRSSVVALVSAAVALGLAAVGLHLWGSSVNALLLAGVVLGSTFVVHDVVTASDAATRPPALDSTLAERLGLGAAVVVAGLVALPVLVTKGVTGQLVAPLALGAVMMVLASTVVAVTITPALRSVLDSVGHRHEGEAAEPTPRLDLQGRLDRVVGRLLRTPLATGIALAAVVAAGLALLPFVHRGDSLAPAFRDRDLVVRWQAAPGTSLAEMERILQRAEGELRALRGVTDVGGHVGRAVMGDQLGGVDAAELWVGIARSAPYDRTLSAVERVVAGYPGLRASTLTYTRATLDAAAGEAPRDLTVRVYGEDLAVLRAKADEIRAAVSGIRGVAQASVQSEPEQPGIEVHVDLAAALRIGVKPGDVRRAATTLVSGLEVGSLFEEQKVFEVVVLGRPQTRADLTAVGNLLIDTPTGGRVRLGDIADVRLTPTPAVIRRQNVSRSLDVGMDVRGRPVGSVASAVRDRLKAVGFPAETHAEVVRGDTGRGDRWRFVAVSAAALLALLMVFESQAASWRLALALLAGLGAALTGGVMALLLDGGHLTVGSLAGFAAVLAMASRHALALVARLRAAVAATPDRDSRAEVVRRAATEHAGLSSVAIAATAIALLPFVVFGRAAGLELAHPLAVVAVGGLVTTAVVVLLAVPVLHLWLGPADPAAQGADLR